MNSFTHFKVIRQGVTISCDILLLNKNSLHILSSHTLTTDACIIIYRNMQNNNIQSQFGLMYSYINIYICCSSQFGEKHLSLTTVATVTQLSLCPSQDKVKCGSVRCKTTNQSYTKNDYSVAHTEQDETIQIAFIKEREMVEDFEIKCN